MNRGGRWLANLARSVWLEPLLVGVLAGLIVVAHATLTEDVGALAIDSFILLAAALTGRWPVAAGIAVAVGLVGIDLSPPELPTLAEYAPLVVVLCLSARGRRRTRALLTPAYLVLVVLSQLRALPPGVSAGPYVAVWFALFGAAWLIGSAWHALTVAADEARLRAALEERQELARDLHDTVADALVSLAVRAEAAAVGSQAPSRAEVAAIASEADHAVESLRRVVDVLRAPARDGESAATLEELLSRAVDRLAARGFEAHVVIEGPPPELLGNTATQVARMADEAINNIARHGDPSGPTTIVADTSEGVLGLAFTNQIASRKRRRRSDDTLGLLGMRERAAALGGRAESTQVGNAWISTIEVPLGRPQMAGPEEAT